MFVGMIQCGGDRLEDRKSDVRCERARPEPLLERLPFQILHDQIRTRGSVAIHPEVRDIDDVRMFQFAERLGLARKALEKDRVVRDP